MGGGDMDTTRSTSTVAYRKAAPQMRASDADRDLAIAELSRHFQAGRLTSDELDERMGQALAARTLGDLREPMTDLPSVPDPLGAPPGDRTSLPYLAVLPGIAALCALAVIALVVYGGHGGNHHPLRALAFVVPAAIIIRLLARRRRLDPASRRR